MAKTLEKHDKSLLYDIKVTKEIGLIFNYTKCDIQHPQISFSGCMFIADGIKPDPAKIQGIVDMPPHSNNIKTSSAW